MLRSIDRSPGRRNRAVTLIEAVLYISIALALIVGGLVFFQQASTAAKTSTMVRQLSAVIAETRILMKWQADTKSQSKLGNMIDITPVLIAAGAVPSDMVKSATELSNPFGGKTEFYSWFPLLGEPLIYMRLSNVPQGVCARLLTASGGSDYQWLTGGLGITTAISHGYATGGVGTAGMVKDANGYSMNPTQAGWMCKYGSAAYTNKTIEPTTPALSGNVEIDMYFLLDR